MYISVSNGISKELKWQGGSIKTEERRSSSNLSWEWICFVKYIFLRISLYKFNCPASWKCWFGTVEQRFTTNKYPTTLRSTQILMWTEESEIDLVIFLKIEALMTTESCAINGQDDVLFGLSPHAVHHIIHLAEVGHLWSHVRSSRNRN